MHTPFEHIFKMPRLQYEFITRCVGEILQDESVQIPEHQRPEMWQFKRQEGLIETIMSGRPMPNLTFRFDVEGGDIVHWLEDGQQRYISMKKFYEGRLSWNGKLYKDLMDMEKVHFMSYKISILIYRNASSEETIRIFDDFQNGVALTPGQRFHARIGTPLVRYARQRFLTRGEGFYDRMAVVFGPHDYTKDTKTKKLLMNAMALAGGVVHGINFITTSYDILGPMLKKEFNEAAADARVDMLLKIFERADAEISITVAQKKKQWPVGHLSGYILATLLEFPDDVETWSDRWVEYICDMRDDTRSIGLLHYGMPASRNWNAERWRVGYNNLIHPPSEDEEADGYESEESE
jgi:hypothetical protein